MPQQWYTRNMIVSSCAVFLILYFTVPTQGKVIHGELHKPCTFSMHKEGLFADCSHGHLSSVPHDLPENLYSLDISYNQLVEVNNETFTERLSALEHLNIAHNLLRTLHPEGFQHLGNLVALNMSYNHLMLKSSVYPDMVFHPLHNLTTLHLEGNVETNCVFEEDYRIPKCDYTTTAYPDLAFSQLTSLQELHIDGTLKFILGPGFREMTNLQILHFDTAGHHHYCVLGAFSNFTFINFNSSQITELGFSNCILHSIETDAFRPFPHLKTLLLSNIKWIGLNTALLSLYPLQGKNMDLIDFSYNWNVKYLLDILDRENAQYLMSICVQNVNLERSSIGDIEIHLMDRTYRIWSCIKTFKIQKNSLPFAYGLALMILDFSPFIEYIDASDQKMTVWPDMEKGPQMVDDTSKKPLHSNGLGRRSAYREGLTPGTVHKYRHNPISEYNKDLKQTSINKTPSYQHIINITAAELQYLNSSNSFTFIDLYAYNVHANKLTVLDMSCNFFSEPVAIASCKDIHIYHAPNLRHLNITELDCSEHLPSDFLHGFPKLESFYANGVHLQTALERYDPKGEHLFSKSPMLQSISISGNDFLTLPPSLLRYQNHMQYLSLSNNLLREIPIDIRQYRELEMIDMTHNAMTTLTEAERSALDNHNKAGQPFTIHLSGNSLSCGCNNLDFAEWLFVTHVRLDKEGDYPCLLDNNTLTSTKQVWQNISTIRKACISRWWLAFAIAGTMILLITVLLAGLAYRFRWSLKYWYFRIRRKVQYTELSGDDREYRYQAFVSYSHLDYQWACMSLLQNLEREGLALCLHHRDFPAGELITDNIVDAINKSRKVLFVITKNFIKSEWGEFELQMASMRMFQESRNSIVVVFLEDIPAMQMPKSLLNIWQKITCLEWTDDPEGQNVFWNKLRESIES